eukprot:1394253-Ditylum_brightwellii.AAC.1
MKEKMTMKVMVSQQVQTGKSMNGLIVNITPDGRRAAHAGEQEYEKDNLLGKVLSNLHDKDIGVIGTARYRGQN